MKPYVYIVVRKDINPVNYAPQIAHAALEAGYQSEEPDITTHMVILEVQDKLELDMVAVALEEEQIPFESFYESFGNMGHTALATLPMEKCEEGCLRALKLFSYVKDDTKLKIKQDPHGLYYLAGLPFLEGDPDNVFDTKEEARQYYNSKF